MCHETMDILAYLQPNRHPPRAPTPNHLRSIQNYSMWIFVRPHFGQSCPIAFRGYLVMVLSLLCRSTVLYYRQSHLKKMAEKRIWWIEVIERQLSKWMNLENCTPSTVFIDGAVAAGGGEAGIVVKFGMAVSASTPCTCTVGVLRIQYRMVASQLRISSEFAASITYSVWLSAFITNVFSLLGISSAVVSRTSDIKKQNTPLRGCDWKEKQNFMKNIKKIWKNSIFFKNI